MIQRYCEKILKFMVFGRDLAGLSTCKRERVGAVIFAPDCSSVFAIGYNGPAVSCDNDSCLDVESECGCVHAEANAIAKLNSGVVRGALMFSTHSPCQRCAAMILNSRAVQGYFWEHEYRSLTGLHLLMTAMPVITLRHVVLIAAEKHREMPGDVYVTIKQFMEQWRATI